MPVPGAAASRDPVAIFSRSYFIKKSLSKASGFYVFNEF